MIRTLAFGLSLLIHLSLFHGWVEASAKGETRNKPKQATVTRLSLAAPKPRLVERPPQPAQPKPKATNPTLKPTPEPEPVVDEEIKDEEVAEEEDQEDEAVEEVAPSIAEAASPGAHGVSDIDIRELYISSILEAIEMNKYYPRSARRRRVEGGVTVSFFICTDGGIRNLKVSGSNRSFKKAARKAVEKSIPFPKPPGNEGTMPKIEYRMLFALK